MSDEIVHNLDGCEISLVGDDLDPEREFLLLDGSTLQQRGLDLINTSAYLTIAGKPWAGLLPLPPPFPVKHCWDNCFPDVSEGKVSA